MDKNEKKFLISCGVFTVISLTISIVLLCIYGDTPIKDLPTWLWWLL